MLRKGAQEDPTEALWRAVESNDHAAIRALIKAGADPNKWSVGVSQENALYRAAQDSTLETLKLLLELGAQGHRGTRPPRDQGL